MGHQRYSVGVCRGVRKGESTRRTKGRGDSIVRGYGPKVASVEVVELTNKKVNVVRREGIVLLKIVESDEGESGWKVPPKNVNGGARVLGRTDDMHHRGIKGKGWRDMYLNNDQGVVMDLRAPLKVMERTNEERGCSKTSV